jgi:hypothetical protein
MTPKEKAVWLVDFFNRFNLTTYEKKECALICVDEINDELTFWSGGSKLGEWEKERFNYLQEVKQEIELLKQ